MPLKFDITLTAEDMYRFNMYQTYSGFHGWFSIAFSILIFVVAGVTRGKIEAAYTALYIVFGIVFLVYPPVSLYLRSKRTLAMSEVLRGTLHYEVDEEGLHVSQKEESALLPWKQIYKMVATKHNVLCTAAGSMPMSFREHSWGKATRHCRHRLRHICRRTV